MLSKTTLSRMKVGQCPSHCHSLHHQSPHTVTVSTANARPPSQSPPPMSAHRHSLHHKCPHTVTVSTTNARPPSQSPPPMPAHGHSLYHQCPPIVTVSTTNARPPSQSPPPITLNTLCMLRCKKQVGAEGDHRSP